ncbi:unnamed protein product [Amoebophrya sp. A25]|nr:unnamed protein product [Amoebophrya sp. A25]|eukprot:GSA25T00011179001.1
MEFLAAAAIGGAGMASVWGYNRDLFEFDANMAQATQSQRLFLRKEWVWLYREDIKNLVGLTTQKMNLYTLFIVIQLAFCGAMFSDSSLIDRYDGRNGFPISSHAIVYHFAISLSAAIMFSVIALYLAIHATVIANSCATTLSLQSKILRDMPTGTEIDAARKRMFDFEQAAVCQKQIRLPFSDRLARAVRGMFGTAGGGPQQVAGEDDATTGAGGTGSTTTTGSGTSEERKQQLMDAAGRFVGTQRTPFHLTPDPLEHYYINEQLEDQARKEAIAQELREDGGDPVAAASSSKNAAGGTAKMTRVEGEEAPRDLDSLEVDETERRGVEETHLVDEEGDDDDKEHDTRSISRKRLVVVGEGEALASFPARRDQDDEASQLPSNAGRNKSRRTSSHAFSVPPLPSDPSADVFQLHDGTPRKPAASYSDGVDSPKFGGNTVNAPARGTSASTPTATRTTTTSTNITSIGAGTLTEKAAQEIITRHHQGDQQQSSDQDEEAADDDNEEDPDEFGREPRLEQHDHETYSVRATRSRKQPLRILDPSHAMTGPEIVRKARSNAATSSRRSPPGRSGSGPGGVAAQVGGAVNESLTRTTTSYSHRRRDDELQEVEENVDDVDVQVSPIVNQGNVDETTPFVVRASHLDQYRGLQRHWQVYDAYTRVTMLLATVSTIYALTFWSLNLVLHLSPWVCLTMTALLIVAASVVTKLDLSAPRGWHLLLDAAVFLQIATIAGGAFWESWRVIEWDHSRGTTASSAWMVELNSLSPGDRAQLFYPLAFDRRNWLLFATSLSQGFFFVVFFKLTQPPEQRDVERYIGSAIGSREKSLDSAFLLPTRCRSVAFLDVLAWKRSRQILDHAETEETPNTAEKIKLARKRRRAVSKELVGPKWEPPAVAGTSADVVLENFDGRRVSSGGSNPPRRSSALDRVVAQQLQGSNDGPTRTSALFDEDLNMNSILSTGEGARTPGRSAPAVYDTVQQVREETAMYAQELYPGHEYSLAHDAIMQSLHRGNCAIDRTDAGEAIQQAVYSGAAGGGGARAGGAPFSAGRMLNSGRPGSGLGSGTQRTSLTKQYEQEEQEGASYSAAALLLEDNQISVGFGAVTSTSIRSDRTRAGATRTSLGAPSRPRSTSDVARGSRAPLDAIFENEAASHDVDGRLERESQSASAPDAAVVESVGERQRARPPVVQTGVDPAKIAEGVAARSGAQRIDVGRGNKIDVMYPLGEHSAENGDLSSGRIVSGLASSFGDFSSSNNLGPSSFRGSKLRSGSQRGNIPERLLRPQLAQLQPDELDARARRQAEFLTYIENELFATDNLIHNTATTMTANAPAAGSVLMSPAQRLEALETFAGLLRSALLRGEDEIIYWLQLYERLAPDHEALPRWRRELHQKIKKSAYYRVLHPTHVDVGKLWDYEIPRKRFLERGYFDSEVGLYTTYFVGVNGQVYWGAPPVTTTTTSRTDELQDELVGAPRACASSAPDSAAFSGRGGAARRSSSSPLVASTSGSGETEVLTEAMVRRALKAFKKDVIEASEKMEVLLELYEDLAAETSYAEESARADAGIASSVNNAKQLRFAPTRSLEELISVRSSLHLDSFFEEGDNEWEDVEEEVDEKGDVVVKNYTRSARGETNPGTDKDPSLQNASATSSGRKRSMTKAGTEVDKDVEEQTNKIGTSLRSPLRRQIAGTTATGATGASEQCPECDFTREIAEQASSRAGAQLNTYTYQMLLPHKLYNGAALLVIGTYLCTALLCFINHFTRDFDQRVQAIRNPVTSKSPQGRPFATGASSSFLSTASSSASAILSSGAPSDSENEDQDQVFSAEILTSTISSLSSFSNIFNVAENEIVGPTPTEPTSSFLLAAHDDAEDATATLGLGGYIPWSSYLGESKDKLPQRRSISDRGDDLTSTTSIEAEAIMQMRDQQGEADGSHDPHSGATSSAIQLPTAMSRFLSAIEIDEAGEQHIQYLAASSSGVPFLSSFLDVSTGTRALDEQGYNNLEGKAEHVETKKQPEPSTPVGHSDEQEPTVAVSDSRQEQQLQFTDEQDLRHDEGDQDQVPTSQKHDTKVQHQVEASSFLDTGMSIDISRPSSGGSSSPSQELHHVACRPECGSRVALGTQWHVTFGGFRCTFANSITGVALAADCRSVLVLFADGAIYRCPGAARAELVWAGSVRRPGALQRRSSTATNEGASNTATSSFLADANDAVPLATNLPVYYTGLYPHPKAQGDFLAGMLAPIPLSGSDMEQGGASLLQFTSFPAPATSAAPSSGTGTTPTASSSTNRLRPVANILRRTLEYDAKKMPVEGVRLFASNFQEGKHRRILIADRLRTYLLSGGSTSSTSAGTKEKLELRSTRLSLGRWRSVCSLSQSAFLVLNSKDESNRGGGTLRQISWSEVST